MSTVQLESPMEWVGPYVEINGTLYRVDGHSKDRKTLQVTSLAGEEARRGVFTSDESDQNTPSPAGPAQSGD